MLVGGERGAPHHLGSCGGHLLVGATVDAYGALDAWSDLFSFQTFIIGAKLLGSIPSFWYGCNYFAKVWCWWWQVNNQFLSGNILIGLLFIKFNNTEEIWEDSFCLEFVSGSDRRTTTREAGTSRHHGRAIKSTLETSCTSWQYGIEGFNWLPNYDKK